MCLNLCAPIASMFAMLALNANRQWLTWEGPPGSLQEGIKGTMDTSDCLVFDNNEADRFAQDGIIRILVTIFKE